MPNDIGTYQSRLRAVSLQEKELQNYAILFNKVEHALYAEVAKGKKSIACKNEFLKRFKITARQFNAVRISLEGKIAAAKASQEYLILDLKQKIETLDKQIERLQKKSSKKFTVHQKQRRRSQLLHRLASLEEDEKKGQVRLCFGKKKLFRAQFHLEENGFAIFSSPKQARKALINLLKAKKYSNSTLKTIAQLYQPKDPNGYISRFAFLISIPVEKKISSFSSEEFHRLIVGIEKNCGYLPTGNEEFNILPKIHARLEDKDHKELYLIGNYILLSKAEAVDWILAHRLDGVIVHHDNEHIHIRSRPSYSMWNIHMSAEIMPPLEGEIDTILRIIGERKENQCIWGFINGVWNAKKDALESASLISSLARGEQVFSLPNDTINKGGDLAVCGILKCNIDTPIVQITAKFFRYLLHLLEQSDSDRPIIIFAHSMGAIICEHALDLLKHEERQKLRIFTFGGGSFITPGKCHPDSHNFASAKDLVCFFGSPKLRILAMKRYIGLKEGLSEEELLSSLAQEDSILYLDTIDTTAIQNFENQQKKYYKEQLKIIANVSILDPGPGFEHSFCIDCYQKVIASIIQKYREPFASPSNQAFLSYATV